MLKNHIVFVTGGAGRLGRGICATLLREGARIVIADLTIEPARAAARGFEQDFPGRTMAVAGDVSDEADVKRMVAEAEAEFGLPDILVTAHGIFPNCPVVDVTVEEWDRIYAVNVRGSMLPARTFARAWIDSGVKGNVVFISSAAAWSARNGGGAYTGSKAAVNALCQVMAIEMGPFGIRVNAVAPGLVLDNVLTEESDELHPYINLSLRGTPMGRTGAPTDIGEAVAFLASDRSAWTTGSILPVTGGTHTGRTHMPTTRQLRS